MMKKLTDIDPHGYLSLCTAEEVHEDLTKIARMLKAHELLEFIEQNNFTEEFKTYCLSGNFDESVLKKLENFYWNKTSEAFFGHFYDEAILGEQPQGLPEECMMDLINDTYGNCKEE